MAHARQDAVVDAARAPDVDAAGDVFVAVSLHLRMASRQDMDKAFARINAAIRDKADARECAANVELAVMIQDGFYLPWKSPSTYKKMRACCKNYFTGLTFEYVFHVGPWAYAGPGSTYADAARVGWAWLGAGRGWRAPRHNEQHRAAEPSSSSVVEVVVVEPAQPAAGSVIRQPRPMMSLDLVGFHQDSALDLVLRKRAAQYDVAYDEEERLGSGTFGEVFKGCTAQGPVAIKRLRTQDGQSAGQQSDAALEEVVILERCANHPHIVTLLDVAKSGLRIVLVFEFWGRDLEDSYQRFPELFSPDRVRPIAKHILLALDYLHNMGLIHADLKPGNVLALFDTDCALPSPSEPVHVKLADLGSCLVADPERRPHVKLELPEGNSVYTCLLARGLAITTLEFRAPEVVFGDGSFGTAVDMWALGLMMARFSGLPSFTYDKAARKPGMNHLTEVGLREAWFRQLGTPVVEDLACLKVFPLYPEQTPNLAARPFPKQVLANLGRNGIALLRSWLSWRAQSRPSASESLVADFFDPTSLKLVASEPGEYADPLTSSFTGVRHLWNCAVGYVAPEVLSGMLADDATCAFSDVAVKQVFQEGCVPKLGPQYVVRKLGGATKYTIGGWLTESALDQILNSVSVEKPLPFPAVRRWRNALLLANAELLGAWQASLRERLLSLGGELGYRGLGNTAQSLIDSHYNTWLWAVAEAQITQREFEAGAAPIRMRQRSKAASQREGATRPLAEDLHNDGSASAVHLGLTLAGKRKVRFIQEAVAQNTPKGGTPSIAPDVVLHCEPGHVYLGGVTGARHQVLHEEVGDDDGLLLLPPGLCSATVMMRSCVFNDHSRRMNTSPNPRNVWNAFTACVRQLVANPRLRLPTQRECELAPLQ